MQLEWRVFATRSPVAFVLAVGLTPAGSYSSDKLCLIDLD